MYKINKAVICWLQHRSIVEGELIVEKSLEISLSLEIGGQPLSFYFSDEGLVEWEGKTWNWGDLKNLGQNPNFSLNSKIACAKDTGATIPVEVYPYSGKWLCNIYEVQLAAQAIKEKIHGRNLQIESLREQLQQRLQQLKET